MSEGPELRNGWKNGTWKIGSRGLTITTTDDKEMMLLSLNRQGTTGVAIRLSRYEVHELAYFLRLPDWEEYIEEWDSGR